MKLIEHYTMKKLVEKAHALAKADPLWGESEKNAPLENPGAYFQHPKEDSNVPLTSCSFDAIGHVTYGSNEGICGSVIVRGQWVDGVDPDERPVFSFKTLYTNKAAYFAMSTMATLVAYHMSEILENETMRFCADEALTITHKSGSQVYRIKVKDLLSKRFVQSDEQKQTIPIPPAELPSVLEQAACRYGEYLTPHARTTLQKISETFCSSATLED